MSLPLHESRVLAVIEMGLCKQDQELAARFAMFNRLVEAETPPGRERVEPSRWTCWAMTAALLVAMVAIGVLATLVSR
ncbi:DUF3040 domain-containing protein [Actinomadura opuntiae]|uniref:DUF3040 domain-containing protein n=1 Tax=Actinomadura sp. OS1-43 TaxID=604315 RepID=UPI00255A976A|nr:DUF3040 domain-containing protein [Actinomadura sp. OS1-43]MDL4815610.1 DUF3040 domain-containing protein [Actinomadura sp. OS1-43]